MRPTSYGGNIEGVEIDTHRWYSIITIRFDNGTDEVKVIGNTDGSGLTEYDSVEEYEAAIG